MPIIIISTSIVLYLSIFTAVVCNALLFGSRFITVILDESSVTISLSHFHLLVLRLINAPADYFSGMRRYAFFIRKWIHPSLEEILMGRVVSHSEHISNRNI